MASLIDIIGTGLTWLGLALLPFILWPLLVLILPRLLNRIAGRLIKWQDALSDIMIAVAASLAFIIILIQLLSVLLRYVFGLSFSWLTDSIIFSFASIFMLGAAGTLKSDGHVRVDIFRQRFSPKMASLIELLGALLFLVPICLLVIYASAGLVARSWSILEPFNESDGLPVRYLFKTLVPVFAILMINQGLSQATKAALVLRGYRSAPDAGDDQDATL
ncbi:MAG: TRAP transporter permease DctQ [Hyphomonadaceae bacterium]|nr:TRAP transporter permease DctQ [Hyphomonadaceae bacterium]OUX95466.1 MAG: hypothetical protein CBB77_01945 [Hyphomonas sp. TMED17]CAI8312824.1 MAG: Uncharacterised protein [Hyphomonas sp. TMED17]